jgi:murein L,D-transpeptidase YafK
VAASSLGSLVSPRALRDEACASLPAASAPGARLVYLKSEHQLCLFERDGSVHDWPASHGREPGKKRFEGDGCTPEGRYMVSAARPSQRFGLFMPISYPNADDARSARAAGKPAGGDVGIHGPQRWYAFLGRGQALVDHSDGCIVVDADSMQELARRVTKATPIEILVSAPRAGR